MARKNESLQMDLLEDVDRYEQAEHERKVAFLRDKLAVFYMRPEDRYGCIERSIPDGQVVILGTSNARTQKSDKYRTRFFRCVAGHHSAVGGDMLHLISAPNEEWPDEPVWQPWHGCRWIYPEGTLWIRKEPEFEPEIGWGDCGECFNNCELCNKKTGSYPRCRRTP